MKLVEHRIESEVLLRTQGSMYALDECKDKSKVQKMSTHDKMHDLAMDEQLNTLNIDTGNREADQTLALFL